MLRSPQGQVYAKSRIGIYGLARVRVQVVEFCHTLVHDMGQCFVRAYGRVSCPACICLSLTGAGSWRRGRGGRTSWGDHFLSQPHQTKQCQETEHTGTDRTLNISWSALAVGCMPTYVITDPCFGTHWIEVWVKGQEKLSSAPWSIEELTTLVLIINI